MTFPNSKSDSNPAAYVHMVHNLIEQCLVLFMNREECMAALAEHAHVKPLITSTVWDELVKTNRDFFVDYNDRIRDRPQHSKGRLQSLTLCCSDENAENRQ